MRRTVLVPTQLTRALLFAAAIAATIGCDEAPAPNVTSIVEEAIRAQGGRERIDALGHVMIRGSGRFRDRVSLRSTILHSGPQRWTVDAVTQDGVRMRFGFDGERCWREDRHLARPCSDDDRQSYAMFGEITGARLGRGLDPSRFALEDSVVLDGEAAPALRAGEMTYVFDPRTHRLAQVRHGDAIEEVHGYEATAGVLVATRRTMTIGGELDVEDHWEEIEPSQTEPAGLRPPELPRAGAILEWVDPERWVVWVDAGELTDPPHVVRSLEESARAHDVPLSSADGVVLVAMHDEGQSARWHVAVTVEAGGERTPGGELQLERWPAQRFLGIYREGDPRAALGDTGAIRRALESRHLARVPGSRWQVLAPQIGSDARGDGLSLLRIAVQARAAPGADPPTMD